MLDPQGSLFISYFCVRLFTSPCKIKFLTFNTDSHQSHCFSPSARFCLSPDRGSFQWDPPPSLPLTLSPCLTLQMRSFLQVNLSSSYASSCSFSCSFWTVCGGGGVCWYRHFYPVSWGSFLCCVLFFPPLCLSFLTCLLPSHDCLYLCLYCLSLHFYSYTCAPCLFLYSCFSACLALCLYFCSSTCLCFCSDTNRSSYHCVSTWMTICPLCAGRKPSSLCSYSCFCSSACRSLVCCGISLISAGFCWSDAASTIGHRIAPNAIRLCDSPWRCGLVTSAGPCRPPRIHCQGF